MSLARLESSVRVSQCNKNVKEGRGERERPEANRNVRSHLEAKYSRFSRFKILKSRSQHRLHRHLSKVFIDVPRIFCFI